VGTSLPDGCEAAELLLLDGLPGVGPVKVRALVRAFGSAAAALRARHQDFAAVAGRAAAHARSDPTLRRDVDEGLGRAERQGIEVVTWSDPRYPSALWHLTDPPPVIFLRGRTALLEGVAVTVVGARRATERARDVAERLGAALAHAGVRVWSGLALGVDGAVHAGALRAEGDTIAVLGTGPDVAYPRAHARLFEEIAARGLLVSEFLPGTGVAPHHFPRRNRILAALSGTTVVVEAGVRSGALITVDHALDLGRDVWAVPGPIERACCAGSNRLLADGARPLVSIASFVEAVAGPASRGGARTGQRDDADDRDVEAGDGVAARVMAVLADAPLGADDLADRCGLPVDTALAVLTTLELHGEIERLPGMRYRRAA
jgi:DNA processing protein